MSANNKLEADGTCNVCTKISLPNEHTQCFICKENFHVVCSSTSNEDKVATKTTVFNFLLNSTKRNFMFLCDICLTSFEKNLADTDTHRVNLLESKIDTLTTQISNINNILTANQTQQAKTEVSKESTKESSKSSENPWFTKENWASVKAPPDSAVLVLNKSNDAVKNKEHVELIEKR